MAATTFAAPLIRAAIATMKARLPAQIETFNADPASGVILDAPDDSQYAFGGTDVLAAAKPIVEVAAMEGVTRTYSVNRMEWDHDVTVNVIVWLEGETGEVPEVYERSLGYGRCVIEVLTPPGAFGPATELSETSPVFWRSDVLPADPTAEAREFQKWLVPMFVRFTVSTVERYR